MKKRYELWDGPDASPTCKTWVLIDGSGCEVDSGNMCHGLLPMLRKQYPNVIIVRHAIQRVEVQS